MHKLFILIMLLFASCNYEPTKPEESGEVRIMAVILDSVWVSGSDQFKIVEARISDPDEIVGSNGVVLNVQSLDGQEIVNIDLFDDGGLNGSGDVIAGDDVFRNRIRAADVSASAQDFNFIFRVKNNAGQNITEASERVTFKRFNKAPFVGQLNAPAFLASGFSPLPITVSAGDSDGNLTDVNVFLDVYRNGFSVLANPYQLRNDGLSGDLNAGDSVWSILIDSTFAAGLSGAYQLHAYARDMFDKSIRILEMDITIENEIGSIHLSSFPASMQLPPTGRTLNAYFMSADVSDPQGLADVAEVYFEFFYPNGQPANNNPFIMVDNGLPFDETNPLERAGDLVKNDGTYSLTYLLDDQKPSGLYHFYFYLKDRVGNLSLALHDSVEVFSNEN